MIERFKTLVDILVGCRMNVNVVYTEEVFLQGEESTCAICSEGLRDKDDEVKRSLVRRLNKNIKLLAVKSGFWIVYAFFFGYVFDAL